MKRVLKIVISALILAISVALFITREEGYLMLAALVSGSLSFYWLIISTGGLHTGFFEEINSDFEISQEAIQNLFNAAQNKIQILSGTFSADIYCADNVIKSLEDAVTNRDVRAEILLGEPDATFVCWPPVPGKEGTNVLSKFDGWIKEGKVIIMKAKKPLAPHFIVVDGLHVRIEEEHPKRLPGSPRQKRRAEVKYIEEKLAHKYAKRFEEYLKEASLLSVPAGV